MSPELLTPDNSRAVIDLYCRLSRAIEAEIAAGDALRDARMAAIRQRGFDSPYERGYRSAQAGEAGPAFPKGDASWEQRLFNRGWEDGRDHLRRAQSALRAGSEVGGE